MKKLLFATAVAGTMLGLAAGTAAPALAAPSGTGSAQETVNSLENSGYRVVVSKVGTAPIELCTVDSASPGRTVDLRVNRVVQQPLYLMANC
jgi:carbohydrate-selective porin OprB